MGRLWLRITGTACMQTLSQARMLRGSSSVNNWKTEPLDGADKSRDHISRSTFLECIQTQFGCPGTTAASLQGLLSGGYRLLSGEAQFIVPSCALHVHLKTTHLSI